MATEEFITIGFTGTREGMTEHQKSTLTYFLRDIKKPCIFRHGDCLGSDYTAHGIAQKFGFRIIIHPPIATTMRGFATGAFSALPPKEYLERDEDIVKASDRLFATVLGEEKEFYKSGTWATIRRAVKHGVPATIIYPNGSYEDRFPWEPAGGEN